jgi:hypothetical protein
MKWVLLLALIAISVACRKNAGVSTNELFFQVEIKATRNMDCALPEIVFLTNQDKAYDIIGDRKGRYIAYGLPKVNYQAGDKLWVKIRRPVNDEFVLCTTYGPGWAEVTITDVK